MGRNVAVIGLISDTHGLLRPEALHALDGAGLIIHAGDVYLNPGSAGPRRFHLPVTVARLDLRQSPWKVEFVDLCQASAGEP
jgi:uncharacterized protein